MLPFLKTQMKFPQSLYAGIKWKRVIEITKPMADSSLTLDIGFGIPLLEKLCRNLTVYGIDINPQSFTELGSRNYIYGNVEEQIPFKDSFFKLVVFLEVIEHLTKLDATLKGIRRVLAPGGMLIISTPNYKGLAGLFWWLVENSYLKWRVDGYKESHVTHFTPKILKDLLSRHFTDVDISTFSWTSGLLAVCKKER